MKKIIFVLVFLFLLSFCLAETHRITFHTVNLEVDAQGFAKITERFYLDFASEEDKIAFRQTSTEIGYVLADWTEFDPEFTTTVGSKNQLNGTISYNEGESNFLEISYGLADPLMEKGQETNRVIEYRLKASYFNTLFEPPFWIIPDNTDIILELPPGASVKGSVEPKANISISGTKQFVVWKGYKSGGELKVEYVLWKKSDPVVDINALSNFLFKTREGIITIIIGVLIIAILIWRRKKIINKIESFVENNTQIEEL